MFKFRFHLLSLLCLALFSGCEEEVVLDFDDYQQSLAVFSLFTPNNVLTNDTSIIVEVSSTQSILDNSELEFIDDADVTIVTTTNDRPEESVVENRLTSITNDDRLFYRTDQIVLQEGFEYELRIDHPNFPSITSRSFIPPITEITDVEFDTFKESRENELPGITRFFTNVEMEFPNNITREDFFHLLVWVQIGRDFFPVNIGRGVLEEQLGSDAVVVNVENSPVFFGAHFSDEQFSGTSQKINYDISFALRDGINPSQVKIELRSVSREYHRYFVDGFRLSQTGNNPFFSANSNNIMNNIEGGFGIFAGYIASDFDEPFRR